MPARGSGAEGASTRVRERGGEGSGNGSSESLDVWAVAI